MNNSTEQIFPNAALLKWYDEVKRDLPWRTTSDPYRIWLSEIILQQTRVDQGLPYYNRFVKAFPSVDDLASADQDQVLKLWEGLGYYSRARNLHAAAKFVSEDLAGQFPYSHNGLLNLKGVGPYTAAAIGSIAFGLSVAAVDGNVYRVLARYCGIESSIDETGTKKEISRLAQEFLDNESPGDHNQAMMELGATVCTPKNPNCPFCPLKFGCVANRIGNQTELPVRTKKIKVRERFFTYKVHIINGCVPLRKRAEGDIWQGLFEFPLVETDKRPTEAELHSMVLGDDAVVVSVSKEHKHVLSHQRIYSRFLVIRGANQQSENYRWVSVDDLSTFALPRLISRFLETADLANNKEVSNI